MDVRLSAAEQLPFPDGAFDAAMLPAGPVEISATARAATGRA